MDLPFGWLWGPAVLRGESDGVGGRIVGSHLDEK